MLRTPEDDHLRQVSFEPNTANRVNYGKRHCGRPKQNWLHYAKKTAYEMHLNGSDFTESVEHDFRIDILQPQTENSDVSIFRGPLAAPTPCFV